MQESESLPSLQQLRYFAAVVDERSFTDAASRLSISQPALSRQIAALERKLGASLLERSPGGVFPTAAGRAVLPMARSALAAAQLAVRTAKEVARLEDGVLEIATFPTMATGTLLPAIHRWHERYPRVMLRVNEFRQRQALQEAVQTGTADLGVATAPLDWSGPQRRLGWSDLVVILPARDSARAGPGPVRLEKYADRNWVLYDRGYGLSDVVSSAFLEAGFQPRAAIETSQAEAAARLAAAGLGPALVPSANVPPELVALSRRLARPVVWEIVAYARSDWSRMALRFLELVFERPQPEPPSGAFRWQVPRGSARELPRKP